MRDDRSNLKYRVMNFIGRDRSETENMDMRHFLQTLMDTIPSPIFYKDTRGVYLGCNKAFENFLGLRKEEIVGKSVHEMYPEDLADKYHEMDSELFQKPGKQIYEWQIKYADGSRHDVIFHKASYFDADGTLAGLIGVMTDITERRLAEKAMRESAEQFRTLARISPVGIFRTDANGDCVYVNERWCEIAGLSPEEALGKGWIRGLHPEDLERVFAEWYKAACANSLFEAEYRFRHPDGRTTWVIGQGITELSDEGNIVGYVGTITDITYRKRIEEELIKREAMLTWQAEELRESNITLKVLLTQRERDKTEMEENILRNIRESVLPYIGQLKKRVSDDRKKALADLIESRLSDIVSPFLRTLSSVRSLLTDQEIQVAALIREGKMGKEITDILDISSATLNFHRRNLRKKLGLTNTDINLRAYLFSLESA